MSEHSEQFYRGLVEKGGGIFVGIQSGCDLVGGNIILFQREPRGNTIAVYARALRNLHDVELALKADREKYAVTQATI
jgi:hypothetical protein